MRYFLYLMCIAALLVLGGCSTSPQVEYLIKKEFVPVEINKSEYPCPYISDSELPEGSITDSTLFELWTKARRDNALCYNSIHSLFKTLEIINKKVGETNAAK